MPSLTKLGTISDRSLDLDLCMERVVPYLEPVTYVVEVLLRLVVVLWCEFTGQRHNLYASVAVILVCLLR